MYVIMMYGTILSTLLSSVWMIYSNSILGFHVLDPWTTYGHASLCHIFCLIIYLSKIMDCHVLNLAEVFWFMKHWYYMLFFFYYEPIIQPFVHALMPRGSGSWNIDITCGSSSIMNQSFNPSFMLKCLAVLVHESLIFHVVRMTYIIQCCRQVGNAHWRKVNSSLCEYHAGP